MSYKQMKKHNNIQDDFSRMKKAYKVPENYFQSLEQKILINTQKKPAIRNIYSKLAIAMSLVLLFGLSIEFLTGSKDYRKSNLDSLYNSTTQIKTTNDIFSDIDESEIETYIIENELFDELYFD